MIVDAVLYFNENRIFDIRYHELRNVVDKFLVFECDATFTMKDKPYRFSYVGEKIEHIKIPKEWIISRLPNQFRYNPKQGEALHRAYVTEYMKRNLKFDDILIFGDADEIPSALTIEHIKSNLGGKPCLIYTALYRYYLNLYFQDWKCLFAGKWGILKELGDLQYLRVNGSNSFHPIKENGGWHFNNMGAPEEIYYKLSNAAQSVALRKRKLLDLEVMKKMIKEKRVITCSNTKNRLNIGQVRPLVDLPEYVFKNVDKFLDMLYREHIEDEL
jgi:hypothetical protein